MKKVVLALMFVSCLNVNAQIPIQEFNFNGTLNNTSNTSSFVGTNNFVNDRKGTVKAAQRLSNKAMVAVIDDLPQDNSARSVSIWVKFNDIVLANYIWGYGTTYNVQYFGLLQQGTTSTSSDLSLASWGVNNDVIIPTSLTKDTWYNYIVTFDGSDSRIYRNGELLKSVRGIQRNTKGNIFRLGEINTTIGINADVDDLKIYNVALTDEQVSRLYDSSKLEITSVALPIVESVVTSKKDLTVPKAKTSVKRVVSNTLIGASDVNKTSKKVEVFSKGEKVTSGASSISDLPEGTYLLKITDSSSKTNAGK